MQFKATKCEIKKKKKNQDIYTSISSKQIKLESI